MVFDITGYTDPGVYQTRRITPAAGTVATTPATVCVVAHGSRRRQVADEPVQRGGVRAEPLTLSAPSGTGGAISGTSGGLQTLTPTLGSFDAQVIDGSVTVRGSAVAANNGTFRIVDRPSGGAITYANSNPTAANEAAFAGTWTVQPYAVLGGAATPVRAQAALQTSDVYRDGKALSDSLVGYRQAAIQGTVATDITTLIAATNDAFALELDGNVAITVILTATADPTTVKGAEVTVGAGKVADLADFTLAELAAAINEALNPTDAAANLALTALGYGPLYAAAASVTSAGIRITSPTLGPLSDVRVSAPIARSALDDLFGAAGAFNRDAATIVEVQRSVYNAASAYTIDYVDTERATDPLANPGALEIRGIGSAPATRTFEEGQDYGLNSDGAVEWPVLDPSLSAVTRAHFQSDVAGAFDLATVDRIRLAFDGRPPVDLDLNALASPPMGYVALSGSPAGQAATASEVAANINALIAADANYGARYQSVASVVSLGGKDYLRLESPTPGTAGSVTIATPSTAPTNDATQVLFGVDASARPLTLVGQGRLPAPGVTYFVTYEIDRPAADYNVQKRYFDEIEAQADIGLPAADNPLAVAAQIAFRQGVNTLLLVQVDDRTLPGSPTRAEIQAALDATARSDLATELVVLSTDAATQIDLKDHIERESSPTVKHYRRGYFGMPRNTDPGDRDSPRTFVSVATRTLAAAPQSPGRGRYILVAPPQRSGVSWTITTEDGLSERLPLDSTYLAVAVAARRAVFDSPADTLAKRSVVGFNTDDITQGDVWADAERGVMASQGVMVVTFDADNLIILDPVTTEVGGAGLASFSYPAVSAQVDNIFRKVERTVDASLVGLVPVDVGEFIIDIKLTIAGVLQNEISSGAIASFRNADGTARRIDITRDVQAQQAPNDPAKFFYQYTFNLRYPALRFFGEVYVDNPFPTS